MQASKSPLPGESLRTCLIPFAMSCHNTCEMLLLRDSVRRVFTGRQLYSILCLTCTQIPDSQEESRCSACTTLFVQFRHSEPLSSVSQCWEPSPNPSSRCHPRATSQAGFPRTAGRPAVGPPSCRRIRTRWHFSAAVPHTTMERGLQSLRKITANSAVLLVKHEGGVFRHTRPPETYHPFSLS